MNILYKYTIKPVYILQISRDYECEKDFYVEVFSTSKKAKERLKELFDMEKREFFYDYIEDEELSEYHGDINDNSNYFNLSIEKMIPR